MDTQVEKDTPTYSITKKQSKYADFMHAYKVRTPKYKFYVERGGDKKNPTILLIMGLGAQSLAWPNEFCKKLIEAGFHVIRFDNRDIGKSSKIKHKNELTKQHLKPLRQVAMMSQFKLGIRLPKIPRKQTLPVPYDLHDMVEDTHQLMNALQIKKAHVLGMSMGGMIAQILAAKHSERVLSLGLLSTSNNRALLPTPNYQYLKHLAKKKPEKDDTEALVDYTVNMLKIIGSSQHFDEENVKNRIRTLHERRFYPKGAARQQMAILATGSLTQFNAQTLQPTVIVHGKEDKIFPPAHANALAKSIPHSILHLIDDLGHDIPIPLIDNLSNIFITHFQSTSSTMTLKEINQSNNPDNDLRKSQQDSKQHMNTPHVNEQTEQADVLQPLP